VLLKSDKLQFVESVSWVVSKSQKTRRLHIDKLKRHLQKSLASSVGKAAETTALRQKRLPFPVCRSLSDGGISSVGARSSRPPFRVRSLVFFAKVSVAFRDVLKLALERRDKL
jgi:hypothetical protein